MIFGDLGTLVTVETIDTGAVGGAVATAATIAIGIQSVLQGNSASTLGILDTVSRRVVLTGESLLAAGGIGSTRTGILETARRDQGGWLEWPLIARAADASTAVELLPQTRRENGAPIEWSGAVMVVQNAVAFIELLMAARGDAAAGAGYLASMIVHASLLDAWLGAVRDGTEKQVEFNASMRVERPHPAEWTGSTGAVDAIDMRVWVEWTGDLPSPISVEKLLRSPGRVRLLGPSGRVRLLKGS